jgi:hypothetical protein
MKKMLKMINIVLANRENNLLIILSNFYEICKLFMKLGVIYASNRLQNDEDIIMIANKNIDSFF